MINGVTFKVNVDDYILNTLKEDITSEDILYVKKVVFRDYLDKIGFDKMEEKASKSKKIKFDDLFIFMDNHMGCLPYVRSDDKMEQILARKYLNHKNEMSYSDRVRFCEYINKYTKGIKVGYTNDFKTILDSHFGNFIVTIFIIIPPRR